jgi:hypothetical protein
MRMSIEEDLSTGVVKGQNKCSSILAVVSGAAVSTAQKKGKR